MSDASNTSNTSNTTNDDLNLVTSWIKNLETSELIELWEILTSEVNNPSCILPMEYFLEEYLPECVNAKTMDVITLTRIVTGDDHYVKHFSINNDCVYLNSLGLWESINEYDIANLVINFIRDYNCIKYSEIIKNKLAEIKENVSKE